MFMRSAFIPAYPTALPRTALSPPRTCRTRPRWRASASTDGLDPRDARDAAKQPQPPRQPVPPVPPVNAANADAPPDEPAPAKTDLPPESPLSSLADPAIVVDPLKNVPADLIDASGALQVDDGSLQAFIPPRRLVRRSKRLELASLRRQLASGFDSGVGAAVLLIALFGIWYWSNTAFNVFNKQILRVFPYPVTCTSFQFLVAGVIMASTWLLRFKSPPRFNAFILATTAPLAVLHACGFLLTNMSLGRVSVAFTHTVKATEPFFSVALTPSILGDVPTWGILGSLFPIVAGVALASANDVSFNWTGFLSALGSNVALQSRNVLSKRLMDTSSAKAEENGTGRRKKRGKPLTSAQLESLETLDNINLFATISILSFFVLVPVTLLIDGLPLMGAATSPAVTGMSTGKLFKLLITAGACRCMDVLSSYMILKRVSPVTHSIGNCVKRAVVIVVSIFFFKTKMNTLNIVGTALALFGVLIYSLVVSACKDNSFGMDSPICRPIYEDDVELTEGGGI